MLTMMLETKDGIYKETIASEWPMEGYVFNENLSRCENGGILSWDDENKKVIMQSNTSDKCYVYFDAKKETFADYIINEVYTEDGVNGLYFHDGVGTYANANQEAGDNSYRYSGANPNNYVCFGSDAATCPNDNLYRIIGLFDDDQDGIYNIKLIKYDYANSNLLGTNGSYNTATFIKTSSTYYKGNLTTINRYSWNNNTGTNNWSESNLNAINLNVNYWNNLGSKWTDIIIVATWYLGGVNSYIYTVKEVYEGERNKSGYGDNPITYNDEIGLMYVSDYGYAASPENWRKKMSDYDNITNISNNWIYMGLLEWPINTSISGNKTVFYVSGDGHLISDDAGGIAATRPVFYLKSNVSIKSGIGTLSDPYRIVI